MEKPETDISSEKQGETGVIDTVSTSGTATSVASGPSRHVGVTSSRVGVVGDARPAQTGTIATETRDGAGPGPQATDADGSAEVRAQLLLVQTALARLSVESEAQIASLRRDLDSAVHHHPVEAQAGAAPVRQWTAYDRDSDRKRRESEARAHLRIPLLASALFVAAAFGLAICLHEPAAVQKPAESAVEVRPADQTAQATQAARRPTRAQSDSPVVSEGLSAEQRALERLDDALSPVPAAAVPSLMNSANEWLGEIGLPPCTVASPRGDSSMVITSGRKPGPLVAALASCADAIEHLTGR